MCGFISEFDLAAISAFMIPWAELANRQFSRTGSDNVNAVARTSHGKAKQGTSTVVLYFSSCYCILYDIDFQLRDKKWPYHQPGLSATGFRGRSGYMGKDGRNGSHRTAVASVGIDQSLTYLGRGAEAITFLREIRDADRFNRDRCIAEWGPTNGILLNI